jgi:hypothetical protein
MSRFAPRMIFVKPTLSHCIQLLPIEIKDYIYTFLHDEIEDKIRQIIKSRLGNDITNPILLFRLIKNHSHYSFFHQEDMLFIKSLNSSQKEILYKIFLQEVYTHYSIVPKKKVDTKKTNFFNTLISEITMEYRIVINGDKKSYFVLKNAFIQITYETFDDGEYDFDFITHGIYKLHLVCPQLLTINDVKFKNFSFLKLTNRSRLYIHNENTTTSTKLRTYQLTPKKICKLFNF